MDQSSSSSPIHQLDYSNGSSSLSNQSFNGKITIKTSLNNMQTNGSSSIASIDTNHLNSKHSEAPKRLCLVCGDIASGFHYGVSSCEACKAFFKRTIQGNIEYSCPAQGDCEINKRRRKACQACRFQKCLKMGMLKEGVRLDRVRGGRQKYRRNGESPYLVNGLNNCNSSSANSNNVYFNVLNNMRTGQNPLISAMLNCEPEPNSVGNANELLNGNSMEIDCKPLNASSRKISILSELVDKELVSTIVWAKQIPGFTDLELNDQMRLLQSTWAEILALSISYRTQQTFNSNSSTPNTPTTPCNSISITNGSSKINLVIPNKLVFASDFIMEQSHAIDCGAEDMFAYCLQLLKRMMPLAISKQEYVLMKALLLTNVDIDLEDYESVEKLRNNVLSVLQEAIIASGKQPMNAFQHLNELLLCLPLIRQVDVVIRKYWNNVRNANKVPMNKLFVEMLESNYKTFF